MLPTAIRKRHYQIRLLRIKTGWRIIECEMPILSDSEKRNIDRAFRDQKGKPLCFGIRILRNAVHSMECLQVLHLINKTIFEIFLKTCRMLLRNTHIFVKLKYFHLTPINVLLNKRIEHFKLTGTGSQHNYRAALRADGLPNL